MKAALFPFMFLLTSTAALAELPGDVAHERFAYEIGKVTNTIERQAILTEYFTALDRLDYKAKSAGRCLFTSLKGTADLPACLPISLARIRGDGGTGGVD